MRPLATQGAWLTIALALLLGGMTMTTASAGEGEKPPAAASLPQHGTTVPFINAGDYGLHNVPDLRVERVGNYPDSTDALQKALDDGAGGVVFIPHGAYRIVRPLKVPVGTTVEGAGYNGTIITSEKPMAALFHIDHVGGPMTQLVGLYIMGPVGGNFQCDGVWIDNSNGVTVRDCWIAALRTAVRIDGGSDLWCRDLVFELNHGGIVARGGELGRFSNNLRLLDCYGYQNVPRNIDIENYRGVQVSDWSAVGCTVGLYARHCAQMTIRGGSANWDASPGHSAGLRLENCDTATVTGNVVEGQTEVGLGLENCTSCSMSGNVARNILGGPGIEVRGCRGVTVTGNAVSGVAGDGIHVVDTVASVISDNTASGVKHGQQAVGVEGKKDGTVVRDNTSAP